MILKLWQFLQTKLEQNIPVALLTVMSCKGSTPAKQGAQMALSLEGESLGTIGGGTVEYQLTKETLKLLKTQSGKIHHRRIVTAKMGMLCGGEQDIAICILDNKDFNLIQNILEALQHNRKGVLTISAKSVYFNEDTETGYEYQDLENWRYSQLLDGLHRVFIVGAGHVCLALSQVLKFLDFHIAVIDTRSELPSLKANIYADVKQVIPNYQQISDYVPESKQHYVLLMTHTHHNDGVVLEQLINKQFAYLGMIGSRKKIEALFSKLQAKGITQQQLAQVYAPLGLPISCQTPKEIAISIAAQLIELKNSSHKAL